MATARRVRLTRVVADSDTRPPWGDSDGAYLGEEALVEEAGEGLTEVGGQAVQDGLALAPTTIPCSVAYGLWSMACVLWYVVQWSMAYAL